MVTYRTNVRFRMIDLSLCNVLLKSFFNLAVAGCDSCMRNDQINTITAKLGGMAKTIRQE